MTVISAVRHVPTESSRGWVFASLVRFGLLGLLLLRASTGALHGCQDEQKDKKVAPLPQVSVAQKEDVLEKIGLANESLIAISREDGVLQSGIPHHYQEANNIRNQIGQAVRGYGGHSSVSGNNQYECHLISPELTGLIQRNEVARLVLEETQSQKRRLEIEESPVGLRISLANNEDYFLLFHDRREKGLVVQESDGDFMFNGRFADFNEFCLRNSDYCQQRLFPLFRRFGVKFPETAYEPSVQSLMTDLLLSDPLSATQLLETVQSKVSAAEYQQRQAGIKQLISAYPTNRVPLVRLIMDEQQPADLRHHLLDALAANDKELHQSLKNIVLPQNLLNNVSFLVWMLKAQEPLVSSPTSPPESIESGTENSTAANVPVGTGPDSQRVRDLIRQRLSHLTQKPIDTALDDWIQFALGPAADQTATSIVEVAPGFFDKKDGFELIAGRCDTFLRLVREGSTMRWDREHWQTSFQGKTPRDHFNESREFLKSKSLPVQWLAEPTDYKLDQDVHGLVLFEQFRGEIKERPANPNHVYYQNQQNQQPTNACRIEGELLLLSMDMGESPVKLSASPCRLQFVEQTGKKRAIHVVDRPGQDFAITLHCEELGVYVRLQVKASGETTIRQFQGSQTFQATCATYAEFETEYPNAIQQVVVPTMQLLGIQIRELAANSPQGTSELP
ncbi:MAG: hypothetical protein JNL67_11250 [Planctomycetaceae bacterium]|nr:hypothetical protein [Planctomycetaceae bacterium]